MKVTAANPADVTECPDRLPARGGPTASRVERFRADAQRLSAASPHHLDRVAGVGSRTCRRPFGPSRSRPVARTLLADRGGVALLAAVVSTSLLLKRQYEIQFAQQMAEVNLRSIARIDRDWQAVPIPNAAPPGDRLTLSEDLDLFGHASLCQLICRARTPWGLERIANWIAVPADADSLCRRQEAIRELIPNLDFRQRLEATASFVESLGGQSERFAAWITDRHDERWLQPALWVARVLTAAAVAALVWFAVSEGSRMAAGLVFTGVVLANVLFSIALLGRVHTVFAIVIEGADDVTRYRQLIDAASDLTPAAELPCRAARSGRAGETGNPLARAAYLAEPISEPEIRPHFRLVGSTSLLVLAVRLSAVCAALGFSSRGRLVGLETPLRIVNRRGARGRGPDRGNFVARLPSPTSIPIGPLPRSEPTALGSSRPRGSAIRCCPPDSCVRNDVTVGPPGTVLLVTGSNMSGKSTLLRALGTNVVLAQAGRRCAPGRCSCPPCGSRP